MNNFYYEQYARVASAGGNVYRALDGRSRGRPAGAARAASSHRSVVPTNVSDVLANAYATLWLRPGAPEAVVKAAFHSLAQIHHPDAGGDAEFMARINEAYATIQANQPRLIS